MFSEVFTVICALLGIIGLMFLAFYAARWLNKHFNGGFGGSRRMIKIIECTGVAPDKQLMIVEVGNKCMLIGVTPNSVNKICDLDREDVELYESGDTVPAVPAGSGFMQNLKRAFAERNKENTQNKEDGRNEKDDF
ncbi:MAG: flagellar biosynthetic protein FliO [Ruminococcus sp.]|nr:flagellar biosynthetic protein FliO [Ruminococcus sp.]